MERYVYRFMSRKEFALLTAGDDIINLKPFSWFKARTTSSGFCFVDGDPEKEYEHLRGIVSPDVCVKFRVPSGTELKATQGVYADEYATYADVVSGEGLVWMPEYCIPMYNREILVPVAYSCDAGIELVGYDRQAQKVVVRHWVWWDCA